MPQNGVLEGRSGVEDIELDLLLEAIQRAFGFDFRTYSRDSLKRRLWRRAGEEGIESLSGLQDRVLHEPSFIDRLLGDLCVNVTSVFRDPNFYLAFRTKVVPRLRTYPFVRIWHAGCSTGQEAYSMAILLHEEGLYERTKIYATDIDESALARARSGIIPLDRVGEYSANYIKAGGKRGFADYCLADSEKARLRPMLAENLVFAQHDLASDGPFNEFNVILCRNVMIYFGSKLKERALRLLHGSLGKFGVLGLGSRESVKFTPLEHSFAELDGPNRLYRRID